MRIAELADRLAEFGPAGKQKLAPSYRLFRASWYVSLNNT
jgi:hypothetical protein